MHQSCENRNETAAVPVVIALIGVGANLPGPAGQTALDTCRQAVGAMDALPGLRLRGLSRWFLSAPIPPSGLPYYVNAVAALMVDTGLASEAARLLARLMAIEAASGRQRGMRNAARTLDLDIIAVGGLIRAAPDPVLPHPRAHLRAFVLAPLIDVAPGWVHPVLGQTAETLLAALPPQDIKPL